MTSNWQYDPNQPPAPSGPPVHPLGGHYEQVFVPDAVPVAPAPAAPDRRPWFILSGVLLLLLVVGVIIAAGGGGKPKGFNDPATLARDIQDQANAKPGPKITVTCIPTATPHQFACNGQSADGSHATVTATVSEDGNTWITSGSSS